jgi:FKBP-type peptidyl-prolyl cis-trans isomerase 2
MRKGENMMIVKEGVKVNILFEAKLETGEIVLKTEEKPLEVVVGDGNIPKSIEKNLIDMKEGETKTIALEFTEAFGPIIDDLIVDLPKEEFDSQVKLDVGSKVSIDSPEGKRFTGIVLEVKDENIFVDFNHPLAGKNLIFTVTVVSIV